MMVIFTLLLGGMTHVQAQTSKAAEKAEKKQERKEKKEERLAKDAVMGEEAFNNAMQAITNQSFVLEAKLRTTVERTCLLCKLKHKLRFIERRTGYGSDRLQLSLPRS